MLLDEEGLRFTRGLGHRHDLTELRLPPAPVPVAERLASVQDFLGREQSRHEVQRYGCVTVLFVPPTLTSKRSRVQDVVFGRQREAALARCAHEVLTLGKSLAVIDGAHGEAMSF